MTAPLTLEQKLQRFSSNRWTEALRVSLNNTLARPLVEAGWLEQRQAPQRDGRVGKTPTEYRLTEAGRAVLDGSQANGCAR